MTRYRPRRSASLAITLFGAVANLALTIQVFTAWRSLKWEPESEWEGSQRVDGLKLVWGLLSAYFAAASIVSLIGFGGIVQVRNIIHPTVLPTHPHTEQGRIRSFLQRCFHRRICLHCVLHPSWGLWRFPTDRSHQFMRGIKQAARADA